MRNTPDTSQRNRRLRDLLDRGVVVMPGAYNALSARLIEQAGFDAMYLSGAVLANSVGGLPDAGMMTLTQARDHADHIVRSTSLPILMDADTGYGGADNAAHCVRILESVGVSAIHLEDQEFPKRCGHLDGKKLVAAQEFCVKIQSAVAAKTSKDFIVIARTDARSVNGYDEAVRRAKMYLDAGADGIFPEALESNKEFARFAKDIGGLLLANCTEFGKSPLLSVDEFAAMGYRMVIFPVTLQRITAKATQQALAAIKKDGTQKALINDMQTRQELYGLLQYDPNKVK